MIQAPTEFESKIIVHYLPTISINSDFILLRDLGFIQRIYGYIPNVAQAKYAR